MSDFQVENPNSIQIQGDVNRIPVDVDGRGNLPGGADVIYTNPASLNNSGVSLTRQEYALDIVWLNENGRPVAESIERGVADSQQLVNMAQNRENIFSNTIAVPEGVMRDGQTEIPVVRSEDALQWVVNGERVVPSIRASAAIDENGNQGPWQPGVTAIDGTRSTDYLPSQNGVPNVANAYERGEAFRMNDSPVIASTALTEIAGRPNIFNGAQIHTGDLRNGQVTSVRPSDAEGLAGAFTEITSFTTITEENSQEVVYTLQETVRPMTETTTVEEIRERVETRLIEDRETIVDQQVSQETLVTEEEVSREQTFTDRENLQQEARHRVPNVVFPIVQTDAEGNPLKDENGNVLFQRNENGEIMYQVETGVDVQFQYVGNEAPEFRVSVGEPMDERGNVVLSGNAYLRRSQHSGEPEVGVSGAVTVSEDQIDANGRPTPGGIFSLTVGGQVAYTDRARVTETTITQNGVTRTETDVETIDTNTYERVTLSELTERYGDRVNVTEVRQFEEIQQDLYATTINNNRTVEQTTVEETTYVSGALTNSGQDFVLDQRSNTGAPVVTNETSTSTTELVGSTTTQTPGTVTTSESLQGTQLIDSSTRVLSDQTTLVDSTQQQRVTDQRQTTEWEAPVITQETYIERGLVGTAFFDAAYSNTHNQENQTQYRVGVTGGLSTNDTGYLDAYARIQQRLHTGEDQRSQMNAFVEARQDLVNGEGLTVEAGLQFGGPGNVIMRDEYVTQDSINQFREEQREAIQNQANMAEQFAGLEDLLNFENLDGISFTEVEGLSSPLGTGQTPQTEQLQR